MFPNARFGFHMMMRAKNASCAARIVDAKVLTNSRATLQRHASRLRKNDEEG